MLGEFCQSLISTTLANSCNIIFWLLLFVLVLFYLLFYPKWVEKRVKALSPKWGYVYYGKNMPAVWEIIKGTDLYRGNSKKLFLDMGKKLNGLNLVFGVYEYQTSSGKNSHTHRFDFIYMPLVLRKKVFTSLRSTHDPVGHT